MVAASGWLAEYGRSGMRRSASRPVVHLSHRSNWLRAAVLGANDGILSTASLVLGVAASGASGAVRSLSPGSRGWWPERCRWPPGSTYRSARSVTPNGPTSGWRSASFCATPPGELRELAGIYEQRGLPPELASEVATGNVAARRAGGARAGRTRPRRDAAALGRLRRRGRRRWRSRPVRRCRWLAVAVTPARRAAATVVGGDAARARPARRPRGAAGWCATAPRDGPGRCRGRRRNGDHRRHWRARRHRHLTGGSREPQR